MVLSIIVGYYLCVCVCVCERERERERGGTKNPSRIFMAAIFRNSLIKQSNDGVNGKRYCMKSLYTHEC